MFVVIFEVQPKPEHHDKYLDLAKHLKPILEATDGFIDNERFAQVQHPERMLSLSTWRDEKAVIRWRTQGDHHGVQEKGRFKIFSDYHLRVGEVIFDNASGQTALVEQHFDETEVGAAKNCTLTEVSGVAAENDKSHGLSLIDQIGLGSIETEVLNRDIFESITNPGKLIVLTLWKNAESARKWAPHKPDGAKTFRHRGVRIIRDYSLQDRREAPQYFPAVTKTLSAAEEAH